MRMGAPYYVRGLMWDHVNKAVNSYAPGTINITASGSGIIDLANIGRTISGSKFIGFNEGDRTGFSGSDLGDVDGDGTDDFAIVSRFGRGYESGNIGFAHVVLGLPDKGKFASEIPLKQRRNAIPGHHADYGGFNGNARRRSRHPTE